MTETGLKEYHAGILMFWQYMKEFLQRDDWKTDETGYWADAVKKATDCMKGQPELIKKMFCAGMDELQRLQKEEKEKCTNKS